ncbi:Sulfur acceptor protein SufE for iron-sulfur cluster assembly [Methylophaga frappieri]|uniref:Sulfur acceptor protein SufE for iron-sulfur cluster assembly n=1 Tax=Methylophaga frappieri (strain ATCC BAA-2434 / DSM 25690 / JAM7) TaxID=754477 RepID=I1YG89_METFJ|nr:SufE family protein [Methylophaga frappieri]AFJ01932.1 Sulfur acceptor protein SufE for iron-sulfur cluster assembly [Methylophaga frappieri]
MSQSSSHESIQDAQTQIIHNFRAFNDWVDRYAYLVDMGKKIIRDGNHLKSDQYKITGCQSNVWLCTEVTDNKLYFSGTSDSTIVAGLMALLFRVYSGHTADEIQRASPDFITQTGLLHNLTSQRSTGLARMIEQIYLSAHQSYQQQALSK